MKKTIMYSVLFMITLFLVGCADAGRDKSVESGATVVLEGNTSTAAVGGEITKYTWKQISGPTVEIDDNSSANLTFTAPTVNSEKILAFRLTTVETGGHPDDFITCDCVFVTVAATTNTDNIAPVITLNGESNVTLYTNDAYIEAGATAVDNVDGDVDVNITGTVNTNVKGIYTITYTAEDSAGNSASLERIVTVLEEDINDSVISLTDVSESSDAYIVNVLLTDSSNSRTYNFTISSSDDYLEIPTFTEGVTVGSVAHTITVPAGVSNFNILIPIEDSINENNISYTITVGNKSITIPEVEDITTNTSNENNISGTFERGEFGDINLTADWSVPEDAIFLDIRADWERVEYRPVGAIGGAKYEYGNLNFVDNIRTLVNNNKQKQIILICHSGSRTTEASALLSNAGFSNVWQIAGGMMSWEEIKPNEILHGSLSKRNSINNHL